MTVVLSALAQEVDPDSINALLLARAPNVFEEGDDQYPLYLEVLAGATAEVEVLVGADPQPAARRTLSLRAIAYATAADLEESLFPEQQVGDGARAAYLRRRYEEILKLLDAEGSDGLVPQSLSPVGSFPDAPCYRDPAEWPPVATC